MPLSVQKMRGSVVSLGFVKVANNGTQVSLMANLDANNSNAPGTVFPPPSSWPPANQTEFSPSCRAFSIQAYQPAANNNGMVPNTGNIYLLMAPSGNGSGNRSDSGAMIKVISAGQDFFYPPSGAHFDRFSMYAFYLDSDTDGDGALVTAYGVEP